MAEDDDDDDDKDFYRWCLCFFSFLVGVWFNLILVQNVISWRYFDGHGTILSFWPVRTIIIPLISSDTWMTI